MGPRDPQGEVGCRAKTRAYITTVSKQAMSWLRERTYWNGCPI